VFVVGSDGALVQRPVQVGLETSSDAEVVSGLAEGEQVVVSDRSGLRTGEKVIPQMMTLPEYKDGDAQQ